MHARPAENLFVSNLWRVMVLLVGGMWLPDAMHAQVAEKSPALQPEQRVDINHATVEELVKVPGMTRVWAARIVRFRPYRAKNDLVDRGVVSAEVYDRIKDWIIAHRDKQ
jgi:DNA uptake protein ComE-like DNA-binding protein